jgi:hypothetical protein
VKIFVGYPFHPRDQWVPKVVVPILEAMHVEVVTGERVYGDSISPFVQHRIAASHGLIGFLTRKGARPQYNGRYATSRWVIEELAVARTHNLPILEVRETKVDYQSGMMGDYQHIDYDARRPGECLVELARAVSEWSFRTVSVRLTPEDLVDEISPYLGDPNLRCTYQRWDGTQLGPELDTTIIPAGGGLYIKVDGVPRNGNVLVRVSAPDPKHNWTSECQNPHTRTVILRRAGSP